MMTGGHKEVLLKMKFESIKGGLQEYRIDKFIRTLERQQGSNKGNILPFVRGLRFSSLLIYTIREFLAGTGITASWGHIVDEDGIFCSRECDIIIHKEGHLMRWNGDGGGNSVMDFKFIEQENAIIVISCKSYLEKSKIEVEYYHDIKRYVSEVWLFAECCPPSRTNLNDDSFLQQKREVLDVRNAALEVGYENFWALYTWDRATDKTVDLLDDWYNFFTEIRRVAGR